MAEKGKSIIIKKIKKAGHAGAHGGSWKVAYADFVTAMMAFFLLMWLLSQVPQEKKEAIANYFQMFSLFEEGKKIVLDDGGSMVPIPVEKGPPPTPTPPGPDVWEEVGIQKLIAKEDLKTDLIRTTEELLPEMKDQIQVQTFEGGVRVEVTDQGGSTIFPLGKSGLTEAGKKALRVITQELIPLKNKVAIEGHTDALSYATNRYTNWELSTDRASAARKEMELSGLSPDRIKAVSGYAATMPLIKENPNDSRNRRISVLIYTDHPPVQPGAKGEAPVKDVPDKVATAPTVGRAMNTTIERVLKDRTPRVLPPDAQPETKNVMQ
jgi:chemotaxis protein MotB